MTTPTEGTPAVDPLIGAELIEVTDAQIDDGRFLMLKTMCNTTRATIRRTDTGFIIAAPREGNGGVGTHHMIVSTIHAMRAQFPNLRAEVKLD